MVVVVVWACASKAAGTGALAARAIIRFRIVSLKLRSPEPPNNAEEANRCPVRDSATADEQPDIDNPEGAGDDRGDGVDHRAAAAENEQRGRANQ